MVSPSDLLAILVPTALVGNEVRVAAFVHPALARTEDVAHRRGRAAVAAALDRGAPPWYGLSAGCVGYAAWRHGDPLLWIAAGVWVLTIVLTVLFPAPLNKRIAGWDAEAPPEDWREMIRRWDRWHALRTVVLAANQTLVIVAFLRR